MLHRHTDFRMSIWQDCWIVTRLKTIEANQKIMVGGNLLKAQNQRRLVPSFIVVSLAIRSLRWRLERSTPAALVYPVMGPFVECSHANGEDSIRTSERLNLQLQATSGKHSSVRLVLVTRPPRCSELGQRIGRAGGLAKSFAS